MILGFVLILAVQMIGDNDSDTLGMAKKLKESFYKDSQNVLSGTKYHISRSKYMAVVCGSFFVILAIAAAQYSTLLILAAFLFLLASYPKERIKAVKLPFHFFCEAIRAAEREKKDKELYQAMSILKNMCIMQKDRPLGADAMIEQITVMADLTKPAYQKMLSLMRLNKKDEAREAFETEIGTEMAGQVANFLITMDAVNPGELENMIQAAQEHMAQERITKEKEKDELYSNLIYVPVFINILLVMMNFLVITFFYEQKEALNMFFNF